MSRHCGCLEKRQERLLPLTDRSCVMSNIRESDADRLHSYALYVRWMTSSLCATIARCGGKFHSNSKYKLRSIFRVVRSRNFCKSVTQLLAGWKRPCSINFPCTETTIDRQMSRIIPIQCIVAWSVKLTWKLLNKKQWHRNKKKRRSYRVESQCDQH